ncbi:MAG: hypothetical protein HUU18_12055 [Phycisphaerales bacterium]|nr:hypothetical protein [Phycisphaerales bacterium]
MFSTLAADMNGSVVAVIAIGGAFTVAIVGTIASALQKSSQTRQREQTKREVAAYIAEGTMTPEQAAQILTADRKGDEAKKGCCGGHS